jgi:hypothetical protein
MVSLQKKSSNLRNMTLLSLTKFASLNQEWLMRLRIKLLTPYLRNQGLLSKATITRVRR